MPETNLVDVLDLRPGDHITNGGQPERVTREPYTDAHGYVRVPVERGEMVLSAGRPARLLDADPRHPSWCDHEECGVPASANFTADPHHRSAPATVYAETEDFFTITAQLMQDATAPPDQAEPFLALTFDRSGQVPDVRTYRVEACDVPELLAALSPLAAVLLGPKLTEGTGRLFDVSTRLRGPDIDAP